MVTIIAGSVLNMQKAMSETEMEDFIYELQDLRHLDWVNKNINRNSWLLMDEE